MTDIKKQKQELRRIAEAKRADLFAQNPNAAIALRDHVLKAIPFPPNSITTSYWARGSEMDPAALEDALRAMDHSIALPVVTGKGSLLLFRTYNRGDVLVKGVMGIEEPSPSADTVTPDILLVPLLAFDKRGYRLGYGGGYYDRTIKELRKTKTILAIGIGFSGQEVTAVPILDHDAQLDKIATETGVFQPL